MPVSKATIRTEKRKSWNLLWCHDLLHERCPASPISQRIVISSRRSSSNTDFSLRHPVKCFKYAVKYNLWSYQIQLAPRPAVRSKFNLSYHLCDTTALVGPLHGNARALPPTSTQRRCGWNPIGGRRLGCSRHASTNWTMVVCLCWCLPSVFSIINNRNMPGRGLNPTCRVRLPRQAGRFGVIFTIGQYYVCSNLEESPMQSANRNIQHQAKLWWKANISLPLRRVITTKRFNDLVSPID
jgi:hypothetical protein